MALQKTVTLKDNFGESITFPDAYIKVETIHGTKDSTKFSVSVSKSKNGDRLPGFNGSFTPDLEGENLIAQAYATLKAGDYSDAADV